MRRAAEHGHRRKNSMNAQYTVPKSKSIRKRFPVHLISASPRTQIRAKIDEEAVDEYAAAMREGAQFPPIVIFWDGRNYHLADGFHRVMAAKRNGFKDILAEVHQGTKADALQYALAANTIHGIRRTNADKRRSVELALAEWPNLSTSEIARMCSVSRPQVDAVRSQHADSAGSRIGADGKERRLPAPKPVAVESPETLSPGESDRLNAHEQAVQKWIEYGAALAEIRDRKLYRADFKTFDDYCHSQGIDTNRAALAMESARPVLEAARE